MSSELRVWALDLDFKREAARFKASGSGFRVEGLRGLGGLGDLEDLGGLGGLGGLGV